MDGESGPTSSCIGDVISTLIRVSDLYETGDKFEFLIPCYHQISNETQERRPRQQSLLANVQM
jgi:hypothetical protein